MENSLKSLVRAFSPAVLILWAAASCGDRSTTVYVSCVSNDDCRAHSLLCNLDTKLCEACADPARCGAGGNLGDGGTAGNGGSSQNAGGSRSSGGSAGTDASGGSASGGMPSGGTSGGSSSGGASSGGATAGSSSGGTPSGGSSSGTPNGGTPNGGSSSGSGGIVGGCDDCGDMECMCCEDETTCMCAYACSSDDECGDDSCAEGAEGMFCAPDGFCG